MEMSKDDIRGINEMILDISPEEAEMHLSHWKIKTEDKYLYELSISTIYGDECEISNGFQEIKLDKRMAKELVEYLQSWINSKKIERI